MGSAKAAPPKAATPLPIKPLVGVFLMNLVLGFQINVIWPFLPFMVDFLRGTKEDSALYVGILTSSYFWTQFISSFIWASLATRLGMRRCLMLGLVGVGSTFLCFGFSTSFEAAFVARAMSGLLNGNVPILKAYMGTITDSTNQASGMSILALSWGLGSCVGPLLGGFLAEPAVVYPTVFAQDGLFGRLPYLLPCLTITAMCGVALVAALLLLPPDPHPAQWCGERPSARKYSKVGGADDEDEDEGDEEEEAEVELLTWRAILCSGSTFTACMSYVLTACIYIIYDEMFPVFGKTSVAQGGLSFSAGDIGSALSVGGVVLIAYQTFVYPTLVRRTGLVSSYRSGTWMTLLLVLIFPFVHLLAPEDGSDESAVALWAALLCLFTWRMVASANCFIGSMIIVNNSVDYANLNRVNGVCQALSSLSRAILPMAAGAIWSALLREPWPLQPHGLYIAMSLLGVWMVINGRMIDPRCGAAFADRSSAPAP